MKKFIMLGLAVIVAFTLAACKDETKVVASTIAIDVNPSVVLELDESEKVINVITNNEDAVLIIGDMDLVGVDYNVAINALVGSMVANGYINELANSVLVSVSNDDTTREVELLEELAQTISDFLSSSSIEGSVITQKLDFEDDAEELSEELDISEAKAELILDIIEIDPRMTTTELAMLSINDLNLLLEAKNYALDNVEKSGSASELGIITSIEAYEAALLELEVDESLVLEFEIELEQEDGVMVYEVEFETADEYFEILINAKDGSIYIELDDDEDDDNDEFPENALTTSEIKNLIASELELDISLFVEFEMDEETDNGIAYYDVEFEYENAEYEIEINALTGEIYSNSVDQDGYDFDDDDDEDEYDNDDDEDEYDNDDDDDEDEYENEDDDEDNVDNGTSNDTYLYLTLIELAMYDGQNGNNAYIAVDGLLYDVTNNEDWSNGCHMGVCAGADVTDAFMSSPHGAGLLSGIPLVGELLAE